MTIYLNSRLLAPASLSIFLAIFRAVAANNETPSTAPQAPEILGRLKTGHPRLLASVQDFAALKKRIASDPKLETWHTTLQNQAEKLLTAPPSQYEIPDGLRLLATSRRVLDRTYTLALLYRLDGDKKYAERAWQELETAANFKDWNPRHFLDTAEMTHAVAIGYDWLFDAWTPEQRTLLQTAIVEKGFKPALTLYRGRSGFTRMRHNWNQVCNGGIGMGALSLADVEPQMAGEILRDTLESLPRAMAEFAPDGAWKEGPGYWNYATAYNVVFLAALDSALGTDFGLSKITGFSDTGFFPLYLTGPLGRTFNYADGGDRSIHAPRLFWLATKFHQPVITSGERQITNPQPLDLLWYTPDASGPNTDNLPLDKYFRAAEVATFRSAWDNSKALFIGFKAGDNKANHSHLDLGSFVFDALGVRWAIDMGADDYNLPGYFGKQRFDYYRLRTEGQNALVLNPGAGPDQDPRAASEIIRFDSRPERAFAIADLTPAYKQHAQKVWRGVALLERNQFLVQDEIHSEKPAEVYWFMHTPAAIKIDQDAHIATLSQLGVQLRAVILSPPDANFEIMDAQPLPQSPHPARQAGNENIKKLAIHLKDIRQTRLAVLLIPVKDGQEPLQPKISPLSAW